MLHKSPYKKVNVGPSQRRMEICSEYLKAGYYEGFRVLLTIMGQGEQDANNELYTLYNKLYIVKVITIRRLK
jgi:hypothetical protein